MYVVDNLDQVVTLDDAPGPETGAPSPMVLADEDGLVLSYLAAQTIRRRGEEGTLEFVFVRFGSPLMHLTGPPNDEALPGHPLWNRGLDYYGVFRVNQSSLIRRLASMNRMHRLHSSSLFDGFIHYIFTFHDSTFECVAKSLEAEVIRCTWGERCSKMNAMLSPPQR